MDENKENKVEAPNIKTNTDWQKELTGLIGDLAGKSEKVLERVDQMEQQIAAYKKREADGFPAPNSRTNSDEFKYALDLSRQGQRLMSRAYHPMHQTSEEKRQKLAKYWTLFLQSVITQDAAALNKLRNEFPASAMQKTVLGDTGNVFPVPDILEEEIIAFMREKSVALQYSRIWPMTSEKYSLPTETGSPSVAWGNTTSESEPTVTEVEIDAYELSAYSAVRNTTLADSLSDIVSWINETLAEQAGLEIDNIVFNGDGTSSSGGCSGILTAAAGCSVTMDSGYTNFSSITASNLSNMIAQLDGLKKEGARFFMHGSILHYIRTLVDTNSSPVFMETYGGTVSPNIFGYPYTETIKCPSTSAANTAFVAFGNLKYMGIGRRLDSTALMVDPYGLWTTNRTRFKLYQRWGAKIMLANGFCRLLTAAS